MLVTDRGKNIHRSDTNRGRHAGLDPSSGKKNSHEISVKVYCYNHLAVGICALSMLEKCINCLVCLCGRRIINSTTA